MNNLKEKDPKIIEKQLLNIIKLVSSIPHLSVGISKDLEQQIATQLNHKNVTWDYYKYAHPMVGYPIKYKNYVLLNYGQARTSKNAVGYNKWFKFVHIDKFNEYWKYLIKNVSFDAINKIMNPYQSNIDFLLDDQLKSLVFIYEHFVIPRVKNHKYFKAKNRLALLKKEHKKLEALELKKYNQLLKQKEFTKFFKALDKVNRKFKY